MLCIDRRCICIVGLFVYVLLAINGSFIDVCLNKWTFFARFWSAFGLTAKTGVGVRRLRRSFPDTMVLGGVCYGAARATRTG